MDKVFDPHRIEKKWSSIWEERNYFAPSGQGQPYCIMIPPPNVTGSLHMGHAFQDTIMDALIRYHRMQGDNTLWQAGTDHAGIATQIVVERLLEKKGKSRHDLGRAAFIDRVWQWKRESGHRITQQLRRMGASLDWSSERFTMDEGLSKAVKEVFVQLYEEGLIYRGHRLVNWDPKLHTALSDLEVLSEEEKGYLWYMRYPLSNGTGYLTVATTRPETLLGDCAIAVHPHDERYRHLLGEYVQLPLTGRKIPIIADEYVDPEFGTGCVKITPAHDFNDYEVWQRHRDELSIAEQPNGGLINILTPDASIRPNEPGETLIPPAYVGLDRYQARKQIIADLKQAGQLEMIKEHRLMVPRSERSKVVVEPYLTHQWYVRIQPLAQPAIEAVESGRIRFIPDNWKNTYFEWMRNIQDWCISRQIWWGHRIPAWYDEQGNIYVGRSESEVRQKHGLSADYPLQQDEDVLDTWFSSALWPFSTLGWPDKTERLNTFYPTNVLVTGFDIIFFWVARMIMMGLKFMGEVPFKEVYIHGLIRDGDGQKMSKSKGNVLDPIDVIDGIDYQSLVEKSTRDMMVPQHAERVKKLIKKNLPEGIPACGTDALRFTFAALASTGRDIQLTVERIQGYRNFCNKLWNAARFVLLNAKGPIDQNGPLSVSDRWILSRLQNTIETVRRNIDIYRFDRVAQSIYEFNWDEYCDWYLELSKPVLYGNDEKAKATKRYILLTVLEQLLRLAHPIIPFITEEIWQSVKPLLDIQGETIMLQAYPKKNPQWIDQTAEQSIAWLKQFVLGVRRIKGEMNIAPAKPVPILLAQASEQDRFYLKQHEQNLKFLLKPEWIRLLDQNESAPESATALVGQMEILIPLANLIDKQAELARLDKEINKLKKEMDRLNQKLSNERFIERAPAQVVEKEKQKLAQIQFDYQRLSQQRQKINRI